MGDKSQSKRIQFETEKVFLSNHEENTRGTNYRYRITPVGVMSPSTPHGDTLDKVSCLPVPMGHSS